MLRHVQNAVSNILILRRGLYSEASQQNRDTNFCGYVAMRWKIYNLICVRRIMSSSLLSVAYPVFRAHGNELRLSRSATCYIYINNSMENSIGEANTVSTNQDIPRALYNPKIHYYVHKSPQVDPILRQMNPSHIFKACSFKVHFNIIFLSTHRCIKRSLTFRICNCNFLLISHLSHIRYIPSPNLTFLI